jgi:hypothetical protein
MGTKIKLSRQELNWIERTADIETTRVFQQFHCLLEKLSKSNIKMNKEIVNKEIDELTELYTFLKTLRAKLELWDCRYDIDTEIEYPDKDKMRGLNKSK